MDEDGEINAGRAQALSEALENKNLAPDEAIDVEPSTPPSSSARPGENPESNPFLNGEIRTLDGEIAGDEFAADAINYQVLLGKIDRLLEKLKLDA